MNPNTKLIFAIQTLAIAAESSLFGIERHGKRIGDVRELTQCYSIADELSWKAAEWAKGSMLRNWADDLALMHEAMTQNVCLLDDGFQNVVDIEMHNDTLDAEALKIVKRVYGKCMDTIYSGTESSSNPMTLLISIQKVDAAKKVLETICGFSGWNITEENAINDLFDGRKRREDEREEAQRQIIREITYRKRERCDGGGYYAIALNKDGETVKTLGGSIIPLDTTRKGDALTFIAAFVKEQRRSGNQLPIIVTEVV